MAALDNYLAQVQSLLDDSGAVEYPVANLTIYINDARVQIALAAECIRQPATMQMVVGQQPYLFSGMTFADAPNAPQGLAGVGNVRVARLSLVSGGQRRLEMRAWEWFDAYYLSRSAPVTGPPVCTAVLQPGISGTLWFAPPPDDTYTINVDSVAYPVPLVAAAGTAEALPYPWTEAVQYYAAYLAYLNAQRFADAQNMLTLYDQFQLRGTQITTPTRQPDSFPGGRGAQEARGRSPLTRLGGGSG